MGLSRGFLFGDPFALWVRAVQRRNSFGVPVLVLVRASSFRACALCCEREFFGKILFRAPVGRAWCCESLEHVEFVSFFVSASAPVPKRRESLWQS